MATSSIIENIRVNNPQVLEDYAAFMEERAHISERHRARAACSCVVTDPGEIRSLVEKALARKGMKL